MNSTHRWRSTGAPRLGSILVVAALGAATLLPAGALAQGAAGQEVLLFGPLGSRAGVPVADAGAPPDPASVPVFGTYGRDPSLLLHFDGDEEQGEGWASWEVIAISTEGAPAEPVTLAAGVAEVPVIGVDLTAPPPGDWLVLATTVNGGSGPEGTWAWHLVVPDRTLPVDIPMPDLVLFGGGRTIVTVRGSACYLGSCGDIFGIPPAPSLPIVRLDQSDEAIALTLSDGSGIATVTVSALLLGVDEVEPLVLLDQLDIGGTNVVHIPSPGTAGRWRLDMFVRFTDGRGDATGYARVSVPPG